MRILRFHILEDDGILEALIPDGYVHIFQVGEKFSINVYIRNLSQNPDFHGLATIYDALDKANEWYLDYVDSIDIGVT